MLVSVGRVARIDQACRALCRVNPEAQGGFSNGFPLQPNFVVAQNFTGLKNWVDDVPGQCDNRQGNKLIAVTCGN